MPPQGSFEYQICHFFVFCEDLFMGRGFSRMNADLVKEQLEGSAFIRVHPRPVDLVAAGGCVTVFAVQFFRQDN